MTALDDREKRIRAGRTNHNQWLDERERPLMPELDGAFADHIKPMVLLSLHTGIRQGNLFALKWGDIDFESRTATLRTAVTKTGKTVRIPLNSFSIKLLNDWHAQCASTVPDALIFPSPVSGAILTNVKKAWAGALQAAQIENFRWHDMRHDFASQLVMRGVDLNTVRELMGHADMSIRWSHLSRQKIH
jgi:integrase